MKTKLQSLYIIIATLLTTIRYSILILTIALTFKSPRQKINHHLHRWAKRLLRIPNVHYQIFHAHGQEPELKPNHAYIIISNHCSHYDIPLIMVAFPEKISIRMIAKKELFRVPLWGHAMKASEFISIDRVNKRQAIKDLRAAKDKMLSGIVPWIAPEGTRSRTGELQPFKKGGFMLALQTNATIIPVAIKGSGKILPPKTWHFSTNEHVEIHIGTPIDTAGYSAKNVEELMHKVETSIRSMS